MFPPEQGEDLKTDLTLPGMNTTTPKYSTKLVLRQKHAPIPTLCKMQFNALRSERRVVLQKHRGGTPEKPNWSEGRPRAQKHRDQMEEVLNQPSGSASALQASGATDWTATAVQNHVGYSVTTPLWFSPKITKELEVFKWTYVLPRSQKFLFTPVVLDQWIRQPSVRSPLNDANYCNRTRLIQNSTEDIMFLQLHVITQHIKTCSLCRYFSNIENKR